jgi:hypothetical protein
VQAVEEAQETACNLLSLAPDGLGIAWTAQDVPFHRSAKAAAAAAVISLCHPTEVHAVDAVHDIPLAASAPWGKGAVRLQTGSVARTLTVSVNEYSLPKAL